MSDHEISREIQDRLFARLTDALRRKRAEIAVLNDDIAVVMEDNDRLRLLCGKKDDEIKDLQAIIEAYCDETQAAQIHDQIARAADSELVRHVS
jgi:uncharacterized protein YaaQ